MDEPLRVLLADFHTDWGGQAAYVLALARGLSGAGHSVTLACPPDSMLEKRAEENGIPAFTGCSFRRGFRPLPLCRDILALSRFLREAGTQVVHTHGSQDCWRAALCSRPPGCRHVRTKHNSYPVAKHFANKWLYRRGIDRLVVVASALKPLLAGLLPAERIDVVHAPVAERFFDPPDGSGFRKELGVSSEVPLIGVVARLVRDKGQADVLRALPEVRRKFPEARVVFAGQGTNRARLVAMAADMGLAEAVHFLGLRPDVLEITAALDIAVLASTACDASSTVVKEALAAGIPVVATEVGGIREIVEDRATGRIVPPAKPEALAAAIVETLSDRESAARSARRGREVISERFSPPAFLENQLAIYRKVLAGGER